MYGFGNVTITDNKSMVNHIALQFETYSENTRNFNLIFVN